MNGTHQPAEDERLLHAKNLLKKFQTKQQKIPSGSDSLSGSVGTVTPTYMISSEHTANTANQHQNENLSDSPYPEGVSFSASRESSRPSSLCNENLAQQERCHSFPRNFNSSENDEAATLRILLNEKQKALNDALVKLQSLHNHYAELHSAYTQLNQQNQTNYTTEHIGQITQLQTALAIAVDERTALQSELRDLKSKISTLEADNTRHIHHLNGVSHQPQISYQAEAKLRHLEEERTRLYETISNQSAQIENQRKEASNLEAKIMVLQQDRNDTQARLKHLYEEKSQLVHSLEHLKGDLSMKEIYIRQLTRHSSEEPTQSVQITHSLADVNKQLIQELESKKLEVAELKKQIDAAKDQYQTSMTELNTFILRLQTEVNEMKTTNAHLESVKSYLEEQLKILKTNYESLVAQSGENKNNHEEKVVDLAEFENLKKSYGELEGNCERMDEKIRELSHLLVDKDQQIESLQFSQMESEQTIRNLEERREIQSTINTDVSLLSEQLQNEKATVSRAIGQNLELKKINAELQDKIIQVTNESAAKEDERISALATVNRLRQQIENMSSAQDFHQDHNIPAEDEKPQEPTKAILLDSANQCTLISTQVQENQSAQTQTDSSVSEAPRYEQIPNELEIGKESLDHKVPSEAPGDSSNSESIPNASDGVATEEDIRKLEQRLNELAKENQEFRLSNERLEYWMTALESENESIGEYIALYRFQRGNLQKRMTEREAEFARLHQNNTLLQEQFNELRSAVMELNHGRQKANTRQEATEEEKEAEQVSNEQVSDELQQQPTINDPDPALQRLLQIVERTNFIETTRCAAHLSSSHGNSELRCSGCGECRGEMFTL